MEPAREREPRVIQIADGVFAQVVEPFVHLPDKLEALLGAMRFVREVPDVRIAGTRQACMENEHAFQPWRQGFCLCRVRGIYRNLELRLSICFFCAAVEVRDVSLDFLSHHVGPIAKGVPAARSTPRRRRDNVIGHYAGKRPAGRQYHLMSMT